MEIPTGRYIIIKLSLSSISYFVRVGRVWISNISVPVRYADNDNELFSDVSKHLPMFHEDGKPFPGVLTYSEEMENVILIQFDGMSAPFTEMDKGLSTYCWLNPKYKGLNGLFLFCKKQDYQASVELLQSALDTPAKKEIGVHLVTEEDIENNNYNITEVMGVPKMPEELVKYMIDSYKLLNKAE